MIANLQISLLRNQRMVVGKQASVLLTIYWRVFPTVH